MNHQGRPIHGPRPHEGFQSPAPWRVGGVRLDFSQPRILGILNVTPDSFSDGGDYLQPEVALARARQMLAEGADIIDLGGASSHPLARPVSAAQELTRLRPVLEALAGTPGLLISLDTQLPEVAAVCLKLGAHIVNDVSGMTDPAMARVAAEHDAPLVITYNNFNVPKEASGLSFVSDMLAFFDERIEEAEAIGVRRLILDPGYGFGKSLEENLILLRAIPMLHRFGRPVLICTSRKGSLGKLTGEAEPKERLGASLATTLYAVNQGAVLARMHDVKAFRQALTVWQTLEGLAGEDPPLGGVFA